MNKKPQCPAGEEGKKVTDGMLMHWPRFPVNIERSLKNPTGSYGLVPTFRPFDREVSNSDQVLN